MRVDEFVKQRLDPKCWKGKKIGTPKTKIKGGVRVNNCVPIEEDETGNVDDADSWQSQQADSRRAAETDKMSQQDAVAGGVAEGSLADMRAHFDKNDPVADRPKHEINNKMPAAIVAILQKINNKQAVNKEEYLKLLAYKKSQTAKNSLNEFAPGAGAEGGGEDPYKYPKPKRYARSADYFGQFEADHFDREKFDDATGVFKGYWGQTPIAYFKFADPARTGSDDPGMGWYYEPESISRGDDASAAPAVGRSAERKQQELGMIDQFLKSGQTPKPGSQIFQLMKRHGLAEGATVTRIDSKPIADFASNLKGYKHTDNWSQSGLDTGDDSYWNKHKLKVNSTKGLFAGDPRRTALYATGNAHETRYVEYTENGQPVVYFDKKDIPAMRSRKTYLTVFDADKFKKLPTGEWFSENPGTPIEQTPIGDPFKYIASQGWIVRVTDDLDKVFNQVKKMHKAGKIAQYGAEGMNESQQGVAEAVKKCPPATQDITLNLANRQKAIDEYGYGPLNPDMPNRKFWMKKVDEWNLDSAEEAQQSLCGNCAAFDIRQDTLDCIAQGIDSESPEDAAGVIDAGDLGYCKFLKFKCASRRTCDAWVTGGPLVDKDASVQQTEDGTWGMLEETYHGNEFDEAYGDMWFNEDEMLDEAEYQGRKVTLGKPMQGDVKKFKVYVKDPQTGNVKKVNFGDPDMRIKKSNPARRRSFRARHNCDNPGPRTSARYWSCRAW